MTPHPTSKTKTPPTNWRTVKLGDVAELKIGRTPPRKETFWFSSEKTNNKWISVKDMGNAGMYIFNTNEYLIDEAIAKFHIPIIPKNTLILSFKLTIGRVAITTEDMYSNEAIAQFKIDKSVFMKYLYYFLQNFNYTSLGTTSSIANSINMEIIRSIPLTLPPLPEQQRIASILELWDKGVEDLRHKIEVKKEVKKGLMQQLLTGRNRLPGFSGEWKSQLLGEMENAGLVKLFRGNVISKQDVENHPGSYPIYSSSIKNNGLFACYGRYMFDEELITWSVDGGGNFFYRHKHKFSVTNVCGYMQVDVKKINYQFLASQLQVLHSSLFFDYQMKAHPSVIRSLYKLEIPSLAEQKAIASILTTADAEIATLEKKLALWQEQHKYLLNNLITGTLLTPEGMPRL